jgi:hypothetical protein
VQGGWRDPGSVERGGCEQVEHLLLTGERQGLEAAAAAAAHRWAQNGPRTCDR